MSMSFGLAATLSNSQKLTPQMQQAIKLLQLSSLELAQEVQMRLDNNPLLERVEDEDGDYDYDYDDKDAESDERLTLDDWNSTSLAADYTDDNDASYDSFDNVDSSDSFDKLQQTRIDDNAMDNNADDFTDDYDYDYSQFDSGSYASAASGSSINSTSSDDLDSYHGSTNATIQDHVRWQLNFKRLSKTDILIADYLVDAMDDMGFVRLDIDELHKSLATMASFYQWDDEIESDEIAAVLRIIQSCDPLGVGARDLNECLSLQLKKLNPNTKYLPQAQALLLASEHLVSNNIKALTQITGLAPEQITPALSLLRTLNPAPGLSFQSAQPEYTQSAESYDIPDVLVTPLRHSPANKHSQTSLTYEPQSSQDSATTLEGWQVRLNPDTLPNLRVNQEYASLVKRGDESPDNKYLREHLLDARLFIRSIEERNQNLLKVSISIIYRQQEFLQYGAKAMQPLILKEIAEEVELHESTVSRLTTSKTILTPQGLFSLKHFFSSHVSSNDGDVSSTAVSAMMKQLISNEDPKKPLSDSRLQAYLHDKGIDIARRTVAKYREAAGIGSSTQRKKKY